MARSATVRPAASAARAQRDTNDAIEVHWRRVRATTVRAAVAGWSLANFVSMWLRGIHRIGDLTVIVAARVAIGLVIHIIFFGIAPRTTLRTWRRLCGLAPRRPQGLRRLHNLDRDTGP